MNRTRRYKLKRKRRFYTFIIIVSAIIFSLVFFTEGGKNFAKTVKDSLFSLIDTEPGKTQPTSSTTTSPDTETKPTDGDGEDVADTDGDNSEKNKKPESKIAEIVEIDPVCNPLEYEKFSYEVLVNSKKVSDFKRDYLISLPDNNDYSSLEGITGFRGGNYRQNASYGYAEVKEGKLKKVWSQKNGYIDIWTGTGWNGQSAIVKWKPEIRKLMNIKPEKKAKDGLREVIYATLDGKIYFFDVDDGTPTREPIDVGYPHKGSVAVDPRGYPLLYAGQGIPEKEGKPVPIGFRIFSLIDQKQLYFIDGRDKDTYRNWGAFDAGPIIDAESDSLILCGENGIMYTGKLNTDFDTVKGTIKIAPELVKYRYRSPISTKIGMENSPAVYKNLVYFADNSGLFQCIDLNTLKPVWIRDVTDDTDSTTAIEKTDEGVFLYTACEVDHHGEEGASYIRKLDALSGKLIWEKKVETKYDANTNGGALASPVVGSHDIENIVIYNIAKTGSGNAGKLLALDKDSGKEIWTVELKNYSWSSPVAVYTKQGKSYIVQCDSAGRMFLFEGTTGKQLDYIELGSNVEASPAIYENMIVVGTRGQLIYGIKIL